MRLLGGECDGGDIGCSCGVNIDVVAQGFGAEGGMGVDACAQCSKAGINAFFNAAHGLLELIKR